MVKAQNSQSAASVHKNECPNSGHSEISAQLRSLKVPGSVRPLESARADLHKALVAVHLSNNPRILRDDDSWESYLERVEREVA